MALSPETAIGVVGAGAMGAGIAQVAATAGHPVLLFDRREGAVRQALQEIARSLDRLVRKGRMSAADAEAALQRIRPAVALVEMAGCGLVLEAIVEDLKAKRALFAELEAHVGADAILASNTSSISITAIAAGVQRPGRVVGMHFFNPAPMMALVEVVSGVATEEAVAQTVYATAAAWGKRPVRARSTPGFIVNRVARPYYAEGLRLLQEGVADCATVDAVMREAGGFRMGPFELMDLIGHDVNYAVTRSVFDAYYGDSRFQPSLLQLELVEAGRLGRKTGRGFYDYADGASPPAPRTEPVIPLSVSATVWTGSALGAAMAARLRARGIAFAQRPEVAPDGLVATVGGALVHASDGRTAGERAAGSEQRNRVVLDLVLDPANATRIAAAPAGVCSEAAWRAAVALLQAAGFAVSRLEDSPALAVLRTVAMLINEANDAVHQQVCSAADVDLAMREGVAYPLGPLEWASRIGVPDVLGVLEALYRHYGEPRYRVSPRLRRLALGDGTAHAA